MKKMKRIIALALMVLSLMAVALPAMAETGISPGTYAYTIKGDVAVRRTASSGDNIITRVDTGTQVYILTSTNSATGYYKVRIDGITSGGYILSTCIGLNAGGTGTSINSYMYCNVASGEYVNIRSGPSKDYSSVGQLRRGDMVYCVSTDGSWAKINAPINGYVMHSYLQYSSPSGGTNWQNPQTKNEAFGASGTIMQGHFNYKVANVQLALGFRGNDVDAVFGQDTYDAVVAFQNANGLEPDGKVGPATKTALWDASGNYLSNNGYTTW